MYAFQNTYLLKKRKALQKHSPFKNSCISKNERVIKIVRVTKKIAQQKTL